MKSVAATMALAAVMGIARASVECTEDQLSESHCGTEQFCYYDENAAEDHRFSCTDAVASEEGHGEEHGDEHGDDHGGHHAIGEARILLASIFVCLLCGQAILHFTSTVGLPYTPIVFTAAIIVGAANGVSDATIFALFEKLDPNFLLLIFLPALIYESASSVDYHTFKKQSGKILLMAYPMLLGSSFLTAIIMYYVLGYTEVSESKMSFSACVLFGAMISATDPVAVVSLLKELGAPKSIGTLIEGESLLNDGTAVVVFFVALDFVKGDPLTAGQIIAKFCQLSLGGPALGLAFGIATEFWLLLIHNKPKLETNLTFCVAYIVFYVAEHPSVHVSGILAIVFFGLYMSRGGNVAISHESHHAVHNFWGQMGFVAETLIFILSGLLLGALIHEGSTINGAEIGKTFALYAFLNIIRQLMLTLFYPLIACTGYPIKFKHTLLLTWGALRGALGMFLALVLVNDSGVPRETSVLILFHASFIALLTLMVNGLTTGMLVRKLGLSKESQISKKFMWMFGQRLKAHAAEKVSDYSSRIQKDQRVTVDQAQLQKFVQLDKARVRYERYETTSFTGNDASPSGDQKIHAIDNSNMTVSAVERRKTVSRDILCEEMRTRFIVKLRAKMLHNMEHGLFLQDGFVYMDGYCAAALDNAGSKFTAWNDFKDDPSGGEKADKMCACSNYCSAMNWAYEFDMVKNFLECSKAVVEDMREFARNDNNIITDSDHTVLNSVIEDIIKEAMVDIDDAEDYLKGRFSSGLRAQCAKFIAYRRAQFFTLTSMKHYAEHQAHSGAVEDKQAATVLAELDDKIGALKTSFNPLGEDKKDSEAAAAEN